MSKKIEALVALLGEVSADHYSDMNDYDVQILGYEVAGNPEKSLGLVDKIRPYLNENEHQDIIALIDKQEAVACFWVRFERSTPADGADVPDYFVENYEAKLGVWQHFYLCSLDFSDEFASFAQRHRGWIMDDDHDYNDDGDCVFYYYIRMRIKE